MLPAAPLSLGSSTFPQAHSQLAWQADRWQHPCQSLLPGTAGLQGGKQGKILIPYFPGTFGCVGQKRRSQNRKAAGVEGIEKSNYFGYLREETASLNPGLGRDLPNQRAQYQQKGPAENSRGSDSSACIFLVGPEAFRCSLHKEPFLSLGGI